MLKLYTNPMSRGRIARWMLEETGRPYEEEIVSWDAKPDDFLRLNPMGKVPVVVHDGRVVTECAAICAYLADAFPEAGLAPTADERADYHRWLFFAAGPVEQAVTNKAMGVQPSEQQRAMVGYGSFDAMVDVLAGAVSAHPWIAGERFTAADVYVGSQVLWGLQFGSLPDRPEFKDYAAKLSDRDAYKRANAKDDALMPA
jgi:glutathione S-transferase